MILMCWVGSVVTKKVLSMPAVQRAQSVSIYLSMETGEINTAELVESLYQSNKKVFIPRCKGDIMHMVHIPTLEALRSLPKNKWGIPEPRFDQPLEEGLKLNCF